MKTISIDQSSFTRSYFEHICMNNIKKIYQHAGKCDDQKNLKDIIYAAVLYTAEGVTDNSPNVHLTSDHALSQVKNICVSRLTTNILMLLNVSN